MTRFCEPRRTASTRLPVAVVDVAVALGRLLVRGLELPGLARDRGDEPERERREGEQEQHQRQSEEAKLADAAPFLGRRAGVRLRSRTKRRDCSAEARRLTSERSMAIAELTRNAVDVLPEGGLERKLALGRPLRVKLGIDVTSPDIHLGRAVPLQRMRAFQDEGHTGVLIIGDYTTRIGDPSGRSAERPMLSDEEIDANAQALPRAGDDRARPRAHGGALQRRVAVEARPTPTSSGSRATMTVARLLERDDFAKRFAAGEPISVSELLYPLMQAYDSVAIEADVELGGTDQLYNLLAGPRGDGGLRPRAAGRADDAAPALVGRREDELVRRQQHPADDGARGAVRPDDADLPTSSSAVVPARPRAGPAPAGDPMEAKLALARWIVARSHGEEAARAAEEHFTRVVREGAGARRRSPRRRCRPATRSTCRRSWSSARARAVDERGAAADRPGRRQDRRRAGRPSSTSRASRLDGRARPGRQAPLRALVSTETAARLLDTQACCYHSSGRPTRRRRKVPATRQLERHSDAIGYDRVPRLPRASGASRRLFLQPSRAARSLKTQQRETSRPRPRPLARPGEA